MVYIILRNLSLSLFKLFFRISNVGAENIPKKGGFILASNHASFLDPIALGVTSSRVLNFMARDSLFKNKFFAWLLTKVNTFPLKRNSADLGALKEAVNRLKQAEGLVLFPGGTRTPDGSADKFYEGVGFLSVKAEVPIVPAFIKGSSEALPKGAHCIRLKKISVFFGKKIEPTEFSDVAGKEIYKKITERVFHELKELETLNF